MMSVLAQQNGAAATRHVVDIPNEGLLLHSLPLPPAQPLPQPPFLMPSSHQIIDFPLSSLANNGAASRAAVGGACHPRHFDTKLESLA